jgi:hypothetical protein
LDADRAGGGDNLMQHQGPNGMGGPLRGTSVWWHGRDNQAEPPQQQEPPSRGRKAAQEKDDDPMIRRELVDRVRREIAAGDYDTPAKWEAALDRLLNRVNSD